MALIFATLGPVGKTCGLGPERHYFRQDPATQPATQPASHLTFVGTQIFTPTLLKPYPNPTYSQTRVWLCKPSLLLCINRQLQPTTKSTFMGI